MIDSIRSLAAAVQELDADIKRTNDRQNAVEQLAADLAETAKTTRSHTAWLALAIIGIALNVVMMFIVFKQNHENDKLGQANSLLIKKVDENARRISDIQAVTSKSVLCPLYISLYDQVTHTTEEDLQKLKLTRQQRADYESQKAAILAGYGALRCGGK